MKIIQGDTAVIKPKFLDADSAAIDITEHTVVLTIRKFTDDDTGQIKKTNSANNHGDEATAGISQFGLSHAQTLALETGLYYATGTASLPNSTQVLTSLVKAIEVRPGQQK